jgi:hypothetical protein
MRGLAQMRATGCPVVFDATHSVQQPGGQGTKKCGEIWKIFFKKMDESELGVETMNYSKVSLYIILLSAYVPYFKRIEFL